MKHPVLQVSLGYSNSASQVTLSTKVWNGTADDNDELASSSGKEGMGGGVRHAIASLVDQRGGQTCPKRALNLP